MRAPSLTRDLLLLAFLALLPFQDTGLAATPLSHLGTSFSVVPLLLLLVLDIWDWARNSNRSLNLAWCAVAAYMMAITLTHLVAFGTEWGNTNLLLKALNLQIEAALVLYLVFGIDWAGFPWLANGLLAAVLVSVFGILAFDLDLLGLRPAFDNGLFHYARNPDTRWHGFSPEASALSVSAGSLGIMATALARNPLTRYGCLLTTVTVLALCGSKGGFLALVIVIFVAALLLPGRRLRILALLIALSPLAWIGWQRLERMTSDRAIRESSTFTTRGTMAVWSMEVLRNHPLGVGFGGFYPCLPRYLPHAMDRMSALAPIVLNFSEVRSYQFTSRFAGTKSFLLDFTVFFGLPFLGAFLVCAGLAARACIRANAPWGLIALLFAVLVLCSYTASLAIYPVFTTLGITRSLYFRRAPR